MDRARQVAEEVVAWHHTGCGSTPWQRSSTQVRMDRCFERLIAARGVLARSRCAAVGCHTCAPSKHRRDVQMQVKSLTSEPRRVDVAWLCSIARRDW